MARRALLVILVLVLAGGYARALDAWRATSPGVPDLARIPEHFDGWSSRDHELSAQVEEVYGADAYLYREYRGPANGQVWLFLAYFRDQQVGAQIHSPKNCVPGGGWTVLGVEPWTVRLAGRERHAQRMLLTRNDRRQELIYWFRTRGGSLSGEYALKWDLVANSLRGRPTDAAFVRYHAVEADSAALRGLMGAIEPHLDAALAEVGIP